MTYQVLARKYRPRRFADMVGQEHVLRALIHALDNDRLHHAFLFTGTRGVGKTTIARIIAKCLNCEQGVSAKPCGECGACTEIDAGRFVDLIEVDAASRTKVDDTRELLDNVQYTPSRGRYKVYLIDEVHMLSTHSFNALLKTLEEPPPHVKFLLATTDPQKLPVTILSRCLQFNLKRLPAGLIAKHLTGILEQEAIEAEPAAVEMIARAADGSLRDALSLMDQAIPHGDGRLAEPEVRDMLGAVERRHIRQMLDRLAAGDGPGLLAAVAQLDEQAPDYSAVLDEFAAALQQLALVQVVGPGAELAAGEAENWQSLAEALAPEDVQLWYQIAITGRRDLPLAPEPRAGFEMLLLRMLAFRPAGESTAGGTAGTERARPPRPAPAGRPKQPENPPPEAKPATTAPAGPSTAAAPTPASAPWQDPDWQGLIDALGLTAMTRELAANCAYEKRDGDTLQLRLGAEEQQLLTSRTVKRLEEALSRFYREPLRVRITVGELPAATETPAQRSAARQEARQQEAVSAIRHDPTVRAFQETFGATVDPESIRPND